MFYLSRNLDKFVGCLNSLHYLRIALCPHRIWFTSIPDNIYFCIGFLISIFIFLKKETIQLGLFPL